MRLISQKSIGYIDVKYGKGIITTKQQDKMTVIIYMRKKKKIVLAAYDSEAKARKVLEDLMKIYRHCIMHIGGSSKMTRGGYQPALWITPPKTFEFSENNKVEV
jgi:hypothetical protein